MAFQRGAFYTVRFMLSTTITGYKEISADKFETLEMINTKPGARTITIDKNSGELFLPTAEFEPADPKNPNAPRKMIAGTFQILKVGK
jgi:hypothetical protein